MITRQQLDAIKEFAISLDWHDAFQGKSQGNRHLFRALAIALDLAHGEDADLSIVEAGTWLHDSNLEVASTAHTLSNAARVTAFLDKTRLVAEDISAILHCIEAHDGRIPAKSKEAMIVHDADTLEKMGPLGILRETWKRSQDGWNTEKIAGHLEQHLRRRQGNLYTEKARKRATLLNETLADFFAILKNQIENR